jgi:pyrroline-5-carboxylate reductase
VISIAAGIPSAFIEKKLKKGIPVIRTMPNTPALIRSGITAICKGKSAKEKDLSIAKKIFSAVGDVVIVRENMMNAITALSGSGPGYFMYIIEAFLVASMELGITYGTAMKLVSQTALGSAKLLVDQKVKPAELREQVTSKGGTTEAALKVFQKKKVGQEIVSGVLAAEKRAEQLARRK